MDSKSQDEAIFKVHADFCSVFASPIRLQIFWILQEREATVSELSEKIGASLQNTSQHLRLMRDKGALESRKDGNRVFYHARNKKIIRGCRLIREGVIEHMHRKAEEVWHTPAGNES